MTNPPEPKEPFNLGFLYHYPKLSEPEPFQLDIRITEKPTEQHYDPQSISVSVVSGNKENIIEHIEIVHPMSSTKDRRFCPGVVRMVDRNNIVEEALAFGGKLSVQSEKSFTSIIFTSTAPIIKITNTTKLDETLRDEIEILWAERRAFWLSQPEEYNRRLVNTDPLRLYRATLNALLLKFEDLRHHDPLGMDMTYYLQTRITRLDKAGFRMFPEPRIQDIL